MTTLREAAQQALEYLDAPSAKLWPAGTQYRIIAALRTALAEQPAEQETVAWAPPTGMKVAEVGFEWDGETQQHTPKVVVHFKSMPANSPANAKGWLDRDAFVAMLAAAPEAPQPKAEPDHKDLLIEQLEEANLWQAARIAELMAEQTRELLEALRKAHANAGDAESVYQITKAAIAKVGRKNQMSNFETGGPALPVVGHFWGDKLGGQLDHGMTLRQYAAIKLKVPNSGTDWLDEMIRQSLVNDFAAHAMQGIATRGAFNYGDILKTIADDAHRLADAMLKARETK